MHHVSRTGSSSHRLELPHSPLVISARNSGATYINSHTFLDQLELPACTDRYMLPLSGNVSVAEHIPYLVSFKGQVIRLKKEISKSGAH